MTQTRQEIEEQIKALQAKLDAMPKHKTMTFVPEVEEQFAYLWTNVFGGGWATSTPTREADDAGGYSIPCLRPEFAEGQAWVMNMLYKARACEGAVLAGDLRTGIGYWVISASGETVHERQKTLFKSGKFVSAR